MRNKICCVYKITNPKGSVYVGQTVDLYLRLIHYKKGHTHKQKKIYASLQKYGYDNHVVEVLECCPREKLNEREIFWINELDSFVNGMNLTSGGDSKYTLSEQARKNLSLSKRGSKNPMFGKKTWISGRKMSKAHCKRLSEIHKGKMTGAKNGFFSGYVFAYKDGLFIGKYEGINDASKKLKVVRANISKVVRGLRPKAGGYTFTR